MHNDINIREDVQAELEFEPRLDATAIGVAVTHGVVTLSGHVSSYAEKVAAEHAAQRVKGVKGLALDLEVRLRGVSPPDDTQIAERAASLLSWSVLAPKHGVKIRCEDGWVTLEGEVPWRFLKDEAERSVRNLAGVKGVTNNITLRSSVQASDVKARIRSALSRSAEIDASAIEVAVDGRNVTLTGKVSTWGERNIAESAAWSIPGVYHVTDNIGVR